MTAHADPRAAAYLGTHLALSDGLSQYGGDAELAADHGGLKDLWATTMRPEDRASVLLTTAWGSRHQLLTHESPRCAYAVDFNRHAREHEGGEATFYGSRFPLPPYPGPAGELAKSVAFDDYEVGLYTAILLVAAGCFR